MAKRIIISVISDLVTDRRVMKECLTLQKLGYQITLIGRKSTRDFDLNERKYTVKRLSNLFHKGPLMYLYFNVQLFIYLLFHKADILWSNDLDTLLPNYLISKIKHTQLIYDSHEYFTMSVVKPRSRKVWQTLESILFPRLKNVITVNDSIKAVYEKQYHVPITVVRNVPLKGSYKFGVTNTSDKILIIQGAGINENRGAEEAVLMMKYLPGRFKLYFVGAGTVWEKLKEMTIENQLSDKILFIDTLPYKEMMEYTKKAYLGLILEKIDISDEHRFSLPNKLFDYIQAGVPILSTAANEIVSIINQYDVGFLLKSIDPRNIAHAILEIENSQVLYDQKKYNTKKAAEELCWENEEEKLVQFMAGVK